MDALDKHHLLFAIIVSTTSTKPNQNVQARKFVLATFNIVHPLISSLSTQCIVVLLAVCGALAKPGLVAPVAYSAPLAAAPLAYAAAPSTVLAQSSQVISRNYNGIAAPVAYTAAAAPFAYTAAAAPLAYTAAAAPLAYSGYSAYAAAPFGYSAYPYSGYPYAASPYRYAAGAPVLL